MNFPFAADAFPAAPVAVLRPLSSTEDFTASDFFVKRVKVGQFEFVLLPLGVFLPLPLTLFRFRGLPFRSPGILCLMRRGCSKRYLRGAFDVQPT